MTLSASDLLWIFVILTMLQPMLTRKIIEAKRLGMISRIEKARGSRVILMVHRQETMSLLGFPLMRYIDIQDSEDVLRAIRMTDDEMPLDIVLHTPGGLVLAALQIARAVEAHRGKVTVFVPHHAMSGGTLVALIVLLGFGLDRLIVRPVHRLRQAQLSPVDNTAHFTLR